MRISDWSSDVCSSDLLLRGTDMPLPEGMTLTSEEGFVRTFFRTKFWEENPQTYGDVVFQPDGLPDHAARMPLSAQQKNRLFLYGPDEPLLFVCHSWPPCQPGPLLATLASLASTPVKTGTLVAYRLVQLTFCFSSSFFFFFFSFFFSV